MAKPSLKNTETNRSEKATPATAAPQALGYSLQYTRLTAILLTASEGSACSLEVLDDVAVEKSQGEQRLVQTKSALGANPVSDRAVSLWKSIFNWLQLIKGGFVVCNRTVFELYVSRPVSGGLVSRFDQATTIEQAKISIGEAKQVLWGSGPAFSKKAELAQDLAEYVNPVLETEENTLAQLIARMKLTCGSGSPTADLESIIRGHPVSQAKVRMIADQMCGWVKTRVDERIEKSLPAVIDRNEFHAAYTSFCRSVDRDTILKSLARAPTEAETLERLPDPFVQQLELIELSFEDKLGAVSDYLRAVWDRAMWAKAFEVDETSFDELDEGLTRTWNNLARRTLLEHKLKVEVEQGQLLYGECMLHTSTVQGMEPPPHFIPGCFHRLADELNLGWHPNYKTLLKSAEVTT